ncbi:hypothetical protein BB561_001739 [Smittium simulii]|uniref:Multiple myeloma tumor-associated protein 2-like N-terminal domain-containing protein n=1 Tax=Smittium simulii TaxID=133385 RepID=A0A2T9YT99_9FUNG|nr:hypothetical protein BB561_001739 [Smittium simulii]
MSNQQSNKFSWEDVKQHDHRTSFLGNSAMAPTGRWQNGTDIFWYTKNKHLPIKNPAADTNKLQHHLDEIKTIKDMEQEAMAVALGLPISSLKNRQAVDKTDIIKAATEFTKEDPEYTSSARTEFSDSKVGVGYSSFAANNSKSQLDFVESSINYNSNSTPIKYQNSRSNNRAAYSSSTNSHTHQYNISDKYNPSNDSYHNDTSLEPRIQHDNHIDKNTRISLTIPSKLETIICTFVMSNVPGVIPSAADELPLPSTKRTRIEYSTAA